jgi:hypothetical protein
MWNQTAHGGFSRQLNLITYFYAGTAKFGTYFNLYGPMVIDNNPISSDKKIHVDEHCIRTLV